MTHTIAVCTVKNSWWWTEELSETCRVLFQKQIWEISASSWFYYKNISRCTVTWTSNLKYVCLCLSELGSIQLLINSCILERLRYLKRISIFYMLCLDIRHIKRHEHKFLIKNIVSKLLLFKINVKRIPTSFNHKWWGTGVVIRNTCSLVLWDFQKASLTPAFQLKFPWWQLVYPQCVCLAL